MNCTHLRGGHILPLIQENCPNLTFLDVSGTNIRTIHIEKLQAGCPKLKELFLVNLVLNSTPTCKTLNDEKKPSGFPQLENLGLPCGYIGVDHRRTDKFLYRILWSSHNLRVLDIRGPNRFSPEGLRRLPVISLEQLYLTSNASTFSKMAAIVEKWHHSLEVLDLSLNKDIEDEHVELLRNFGMPKLHTLDLSSTSITADGVRSVLNGCPNLTDLNLVSCRGVPRGIKRRHQGESLRNLPQRMMDIEQESAESE
ncbi:F-box/LRR-repeat protein 6-like [Orbicella faveolata]|uniref:F-box/LRR-repeat protein 6-like n=1 Tax=Orbicella faveolata TaxID=48498 RepID=UPI0009E220C3|nr:F-box/LRR-repeat protein 6-like [Orbicella faveolata]